VKTRTIYRARNIAAGRWSAGYFDVAERQFRTFGRELMRRMDERDQLLAEKNERIARLNAVAAARPGIKPWSNGR